MDSVIIGSGRTDATHRQLVFLSIADADAETAPPLSDAEVDRHFADRLAGLLAARATPEDMLSLVYRHAVLDALSRQAQDLRLG